MSLLSKALSVMLTLHGRDEQVARLIVRDTPSVIVAASLRTSNASQRGTATASVAHRHKVDKSYVSVVPLFKTETV